MALVGEAGKLGRLSAPELNVNVNGSIAEDALYSTLLLVGRAKI
jgi:hypothetical protein